MQASNSAHHQAPLSHTHAPYQQSYPPVLLPHPTTANQAPPSVLRPPLPILHNQTTNATGPFAPKTTSTPMTHSPHALSAAASTPTPCPSSNARQKKPGMANTTPSPNAPTERSSSKPPANAYARDGNAEKAASNATAMPTPAPDVVLPPTEFSAALARRSSQALTPCYGRTLAPNITDLPFHFLLSYLISCLD